MDLCTRKVLARRISNTLEAPFCVEAFNEAIHKFGSPEIMNMEHGRAIGSSGHATSRVAVHIFRLDRRAETGREPDINATRCLQRKHLPVPDGKGRWVDNIFIERLWWSLEYECVYLHAWETGSQARKESGAGSPFTITIAHTIRRKNSPLDCFLVLLKHGGQPPAVVYVNSIGTDQQVQTVS